VNSLGELTANPTDWSKNTNDSQLVTVGAPFYFYFGLKRGASSFDRFRGKWVDTEKIIT
jgi:hypothetical protein